MKLIRFGTIGNEKPGVQLQDGTRIDVSKFTKDYDEFFFWFKRNTISSKMA